APLRFHLGGRPLTTLWTFLNGALTMGFAVAALFFLRFWWRTRDGLFLAFSVAFLALGAAQALLALSGVPQENRVWISMLRFAGFGFLIVAIAIKNWGRGSSR